MLTTLPRRTLMALVRIYRVLSLGQPASCRFEPSCSAYALTALAQHGAAAGSCLSVYRVLRCGPWCAGGHDPVPSEAPRALRRLAGKARASGSATIS